MEKALQEGRILLVHDLGFGELVAASGARLPSVITFRLRNMHPDRVNDTLQSMLSQHGAALEHGAMISVTEGQVRAAVLAAPVAHGAEALRRAQAERAHLVIQTRGYRRLLLHVACTRPSGGVPW